MHRKSGSRPALSVPGGVKWRSRVQVPSPYAGQRKSGCQKRNASDVPGLSGGILPGFSGYGSQI